MPDFILTPEQQAILGHDLRLHARVLAGPGTGKTATLVAFANRLLAEDTEQRVKLLTFTRAATGELARRVADQPAATTERPSTIHSFAIAVLLRNHGVGDLPEPLRFADNWEYDNIVRPTLARRARIRIRQLDRLVREMAANWESLRPERDRTVPQADRARFLGVWNEHRRILGYTLLAELPYALREALQNHPDMVGIDYDALIVDEYQDLNACDLGVIRLIAERGCSIIAAGDDDQSIYSFRKAAPEGIRRFPDDYPGCADYPLSITKRCGRRIVEWANYLIAGDPDRPSTRPALRAAEDAPEGEVGLLAFRGEAAEAQGVATLVHRLINVERVPPSEILVLLRSDYHGLFSRPIRERLARLGVPCTDPDIVDGILAQPDNRRLLGILRLLVDRTDSLAWASLLQMTEGIGPAFFEYVYDRARGQRSRFGQELLDAHQDGFPGGPAASVRRARGLIDSILPWLEAHPAPDEQPEGGWAQWILEVGEGVVPAPNDELRELLLSLQDLVEPDEGLGRYLGQIGPLGNDLAIVRSGGVRVMTMTGAKGLTVRAGIIAAVEDGIIPRPDCDLGEERRLFYVAMTRARELLFCTWARQRRGPTARAGQPRVATPRPYSSFLRGGMVRSEDGPTFIRRRWPDA